MQKPSRLSYPIAPIKQRQQSKAKNSKEIKEIKAKKAKSARHIKQRKSGPALLPKRGGSRLVKQNGKEPSTPKYPLKWQAAKS